MKIHAEICSASMSIFEASQTGLFSYIFQYFHNLLYIQKKSISSVEVVSHYLLKNISFFINFFWAPGGGGGGPPSTLRFTVLHNDPAAPQDHCGRRRIRTRDFCPRSLVHYQLSHHISLENITIQYTDCTRGYTEGWDDLH